MNIDGYWFLVLVIAVGAAVCVALAWMSRRRRKRIAHDLERKTEVKSWENEGGQLAAPPAKPVRPST